MYIQLGNPNKLLIKIINDGNNKKRGIFVDCGKYGSDWLAISSCHYFIQNLVQRSDSDSSSNISSI